MASSQRWTWLLLACFLCSKVQFSSGFRASWAGVTDTPLYRCTADTRASLVQSLHHGYRCFVKYQYLTQCVPAETALETYVHHVMNTLPCGTISFSQEIFQLRTRKDELTWHVVAPNNFYLNVTFYEFTLPAPYGKCYGEGRPEKIDGSYIETVVISQMHSGMVDDAPDDVQLCGRRRPFSLIFGSSQIRLTYKCIDPRICRGTFLLQHQVCDLKACSGHVSRIPVSHLRLSASERSITSTILTSVSFIRIGSLVQAYCLHITVPRLARLTVSVGKIQIPNYDKFFAIAVYDGPYAHPGSLHPDNEILYQWLPITLTTFQGFVNIECFLSVCDDIQIYYSHLTYVSRRLPSKAWTHIEQGHVHSLSVNASNCGADGTSLSERPNLLYCLWHLKNVNPNGTVLVSFDSLYLGWEEAVGTRDAILCPLAGITITDHFRYILLQEAARYDANVLDSLFPEITLCGKVPFKDAEGPGGVVYDLPMRTWTSTSSQITILVYAYGHFVNLKQLRVLLNVSEDTCVGLFASCPLVKGDRLVEVGIPGVYSMKYLDKIRSFRCTSYSRMYVFQIRPWLETRALHILGTFCSADGGTVVTLELLVKDNDDLCLTVQYHPYFAQSTVLACHVIFLSNTDTFSYQLESRAPWSSPCSRSAAFHKPSYDIYGPSHSREQESFLFGGKVTGESIRMMKGRGFARCFSFELRARLLQSCGDQDSGREELEDKMIIQDLNHWYVPTLCSLYTVPVAKDASVILSVALQNEINSLVYYVSEKVRKNEFWFHRRNGEYGRTGLEVTADANDFCPQNCSHFVLYIAYMEPGAGKYVLLEWRIQERHYVVTVAQVAIAMWLLYVKRLEAVTPCDSLGCELSLRIRVSDLYPRQENVALAGASTLHPFAKYYYLWTSKQYTWQGSEDLCQSAGMHLASITSETEYSIVRGMLYGEVRTNGPFQQTPILTPCRIESALCMVYIGLHKKEVRI